MSTAGIGLSIPSSQHCTCSGKTCAITQDNTAVIHQIGDGSSTCFRVAAFSRLYRTFSCGSAIINSIWINDTAIGIIDNFSCIDVAVNRIQENGFMWVALLGDGHCISGMEFKGLAGIIDFSALITSNLPADKVVAFRCLD